MFENLKLGQKITLGFATLIMIVVILGGLAVWTMRGVSSDSKLLAEEYAPEVTVTVKVERELRELMFDMRGYGYTEEESFYTSAMQSLAELNTAVKEADDLGRNTKHLVKLKDNLNDISSGVNDYAALINQTRSTIASIEANRKMLDQSAASFIQNSQDYLSSMETTMEQELKSGLGASALTERLKKISQINDIIDAGNTVRIAVWRSQAERDPQIMNDIMSNFDKINILLQDIRTVTRQDANLRQLDTIGQAVNQYRTAMNDLVVNWQKTQDLNNQRVVAAEKTLAAARASAEIGIANTEATAKNADTALSAASTAMVVGLIVAIIIGVAAAIFITRSITGPINKVISGLASGAEQVASASQQVASASQQMAEGASEQASSLEESTSSLEEIGSMSRQNAENANQAKSMMNEAREIVAKVDENMKNLVTATEEIEKSSEETGKIIKTIDDIAFQTNLLALNAAVEAARAGEAGAGFAVVADEVRNLALRAAEAAKNTAGMIENTIRAVRNGSQLTGSTQEAYRENIEIAQKVGNIVDEIAAASNEQAQGIQQINIAIGQMDKVTQASASNAEESASASEEMSAQASELKELVNMLVSIVGETNGNGSGPGRTLSMRKHVHSLTDPSRIRSAGNNRINRLAAATSKSIHPSDVIPLGDDEFDSF